MWSCLTEYDEDAERKFLKNEGRKEGIAEGLEKGLVKGRKEGMSEGRRMEAERMGTLMTKLKSLGRVDDAFRAASDAAYRESLYKEFKL